LKKSVIYRIARSALSRTHRSHLILHVTNRCPLRCKTCFVRFSDAPSAELSINEIKSLAQSLPGLIWLDIGGGEPFLRNDLPEICGLFDVSAISIPTNGFDPGQIFEKTKAIRASTDAELLIALSLDGFETTNDRIRASGSYRKVIETLDLLKTISGIRIKINTVLCNVNYPEIIPFMNHVRKFDVDFHSIIFLRGEPRDSIYQPPTTDELLVIRDNIFTLWDSYNYGTGFLKSLILKAYQRYLYQTSIRVMNEKKQIPACCAWNHHLVVYPNGDVAFCEMLESFGNLREHPLPALLESNQSVKQQKSIRAQECFCYHNCNMLDNCFLNPPNYLNILLSLWQTTRK